MQKINPSELDDLWKVFPHTLAQKLARGRWLPYPYLVYISEILAEEIGRGDARLIFELPPRHGKSELISVYTPTWFLEHFPRKGIILASYESDFAMKWGRRVRNQIDQSQDLLSVRISQDSSAAYRFDTTVGGAMVTAGIGGAMTGRGADLLIIDDPVKNQADAMSELKRENAIEWFRSTALTRLEPGGSVIILQTRWHEGDLAGWVQSEGGYKVVRLPALAEENDPIGRTEGEALCPERYDEKALAKIKVSIGTKWFNSLYQQSPLPDEGVKFKKDWIRYYKRDDLLTPDKKRISFEMMAFSWDFTFDGKENNDWNVGQVWGFIENRAYLLFQYRQKATFIEQRRMLINGTIEYPMYTGCLIEKKANGAALIDSVRDEVLGIIEIEPQESKEVRADYVTPLFEAGNIYFPDPDDEPWVQALLDEVFKFPSAKHDDQVDAMTQMLRWWAERRLPSIRVLGGEREDDD